MLIELAETAREEQAKAEGAHDKALLTAARGFANRVDHDTTHGEHVRLLARALFHQLRDVHGVPDDAACCSRSRRCSTTSARSSTSAATTSTAST